MYRQSSHNILPANLEDTSLLKSQLQREIHCLEMQLSKLRRRDDFLDLVTLQTYQEMISSRQDMLDSL
ncbi:hypothetical protein [Agaribacterium haliotis]|uniref:hypothetical protein n=1 Tax=Agaribacterium haliotis TaxID=2013869 RepID=UPI000BB5752A|nr:hypothetical protein [Agaribacterium haliotis]